METKSTFQHDQRFKKTSYTRRGSNKYKKFVGNRAEGQGFADKRKKKIKQEYFRMLQKEKRKGNSQPQRVWPPRMDEDETEEDSVKIKSTAPKTVQAGECSEQLHNVEESHRTDLRFNRMAEEESNSSNSQHTDRHNRKPSQWKFKKEGKNIFSRAIHEAKLRKDEAKKQREKKQKDKEERETALQNYRKKKRENYYKFHCKKTKKGQPLMRYQMEFLLQKIEKQKERENK